MRVQIACALHKGIRAPKLLRSLVLRQLLRMSPSGCHQGSAYQLPAAAVFRDYEATTEPNHLATFCEGIPMIKSSCNGRAYRNTLRGGVRSVNLAILAAQTNHQNYPQSLG